MTARSAGQSMDFEPVPGWYGGKTGALTHVHVDVLADAAAQVAKYEAGVYTLLGYGRQPLSPDAATRYTTDLKLKDQLTLVPSGTSFWVGFNLKSGPFAGIDAGRAGRHAFITAIDRQALVAAVCNQKTTCIAATGGLISKGLLGYLGDGADSNAKFDPAKAKAEYQEWDPSGAKVKGLTYTYDTNAFNKTVCDDLAAQWKKNLGVTVACTEMDRLTFFEQRNRACAYPMFRQSWNADYDHPQNWFDYLFVTGAASSGSCYSNSSLDEVVARADASRPVIAAPNYKVAGYTLVTDAAFGGLLYGIQQYLVHPFVRGAGGNALYDNPWTGLRIVKH
jgi:ABC-type oligopeptide transport system substrate-binding subunit